MRSGISVSEFWDLTPYETFLSIEAAIWRDERDQKILLKMAWEIAALSRSKRLPKLQILLNSKPARKLKGEELREKRRDFKAMTQNLDLKKINEIKRKK